MFIYILSAVSARGHKDNAECMCCPLVRLWCGQ